ncbi:MAG: hypothetical protein ACLPID_08990 [Beijerinckiaceae bacterium]
MDVIIIYHNLAWETVLGLLPHSTANSSTKTASASSIGTAAKSVRHKGSPCPTSNVI